MTKKLKLAVKWELTAKGGIQLFDADGNKLAGKDARWGGWFNCYNNPALTSLEGAPKEVGGGFNCYNNPALTSLEGAPKEVGGGFNCSNNPALTSLEGAPKEVGGWFNCYNNPALTSLEGAPKEVGGGFNCSNNPALTSLEGAPKEVGGGFNCYNNPALTSLEGAPKEVGGGFNCYNNPALTSLEGAPKEVGGGFNCSNNPALTSLEGAPKEVGGWFNCYNNPALTSLEGKSKTVSSTIINARINISLNLRGKCFIDGIMGFVLSKRSNITKMRKFGSKKTMYVVSDDKGNDAHGETVKEAMFDLRFKTADRDVSAYKGMKKTTVKTKEDWAIAYHIVTGSCRAGIQDFIQKQGATKDKYTLTEILSMTENAYRGDMFRKVVEA